VTESSTTNARLTLIFHPDPVEGFAVLRLPATRKAATLGNQD
jgi:hypothetical protein